MMSVHRSTSLSTGINSTAKGSFQIIGYFILSDGRNTEIVSWIAQAQMSFPEIEIGTNK